MLPPEILIDILSRLPVKFLLQFRCVSKTWRCVIDGQDFIKMHLQKSAETHSNYNFILLEPRLNLYILDSGLLDEARVANTPFLCKDLDHLSNTCHGLVLAIRSDFFAPLTLWNPFLRKRMIFSNTPFEYPSALSYFSQISYGLGYESSSDDYKVFRTVEFRIKESDEWVCSKTQIYSLKSNVWKEVQAFPYPLAYTTGKWGGHVNGALHVLLKDDHHLYSDKSYKIMGFSVENETHFEVMLPLNIPNEYVFLGLDLLGGCLSLACDGMSRVNIWVMKEYGVQDSWTNLISINTLMHDPRDTLKPLVFSKDRQKVLFYCYEFQFVWYDLKTQTIDEVEIPGVPNMFFLEVSIPSLVLPGGSWEHDGAKKINGQERKQKKIKKKRDDFLSAGFKLVL